LIGESKFQIVGGRLRRVLRIYVLARSVTPFIVAVANGPSGATGRRVIASSKTTRSARRR
jgi:hypothetical protein